MNGPSLFPACPLYQGGWGSVWDPEPSTERVGDWGGPETVWALLCVAERVPQGQTESGGIVLAANAGPRVPSGGVTLKRRCTSDLQSSLIVNKLLSLSLSLPPSDYVALKYWCWRTGEEPLHAEYGQVQRGVSSVYHQLSHSSPGSWCLLQPVA